MDYKEIIGERITNALALRGVKQKELAEKLNVKDNIISYYCSGSRTPNTAQIIEIAKILNVPTDYLLGLSELPDGNMNLTKAAKFLGISEKTVQIMNAINCSEYSYYDDIINALILAINNDYDTLELIKQATELHSEKGDDKLHSPATVTEYDCNDPTYFKFYFNNNQAIIAGTAYRKYLMRECYDNFKSILNSVLLSLTPDNRLSESEKEYYTRYTAKKITPLIELCQKDKKEAPDNGNNNSEDK